MPPFAMGICDQFISARLLDRYPQLYQLGQKGVFFRMHSFWAWILNAFYHSLILYIFGELFWLRDGPMSDGQIAGHWVWGAAMYLSVLTTVLGKAALITNTWTKYHVIAIPGSLLLYISFIALYGSVAPLIGFSKEWHGVIPKAYGSPVFWLQGLVLPILCLLRDFAWK